MQSFRGEVAKSQESIAQFSGEAEGDASRMPALFEGAGAAVGAFAIAIGAAIAVVAGLAYAINKFTDSAIQAFSQRAASIRSYTTLLGDAKKAELEYFKASQLAQRIDLTQEQTEGAQNRLIVAGFRNNGPNRDLDKALLTAVDLAAVRPENERQTALKSVALAFSQIRNKGRLQSEELNRQLGQYLNIGMVKDEIASTMGVKRDQVDKLIQQGRVSSDVGIAAVEKATLRQLGTNRLGEFSTGSAGSLTALLSNKDEAFTNLLKSIDSDQLPGIQRYKKSIEDLTQSMTMGTESGNNLRLVFEDVSNVGANLKSVGNDFLTGFLTSFADSYKQALEEFGFSAEGSKSAFDNLSAAAKWLGEALGKVGYVAAYMVHGFERIGVIFGVISDGASALKEAVLSAFDTVYNFFTDFFERLGLLIEGLGQIIDGALNFSLSELKQGKETILRGLSSHSGSAISSPSGEVNTASRRAEPIGAVYESSGSKDDWGPSSSSQPQNHPAVPLKGTRGGRGSGGGGGGGIGVSFDYASSLLDLRPALQMSVAPLPSVLSSPAFSSSPVYVDRVEIRIESEASSPTELADAVYQTFLQKISRLSRNPKPQTV